MKSCAPLYPKLDLHPYLWIYDEALQRGGITSRQTAELLGMSEAGAKARLYRLVFTGALQPTGERPVVYKPGQASGCRKIIDLAKVKSIAWVDMQAISSPPGYGASL